MIELSGISGELATHKESLSVRRVPVLSYTRVVGYFSPSANWNKGKAEEISQRRLFDANKYCAKEFTEAP